jgi:hypothetical protein
VPRSDRGGWSAAAPRGGDLGATPVGWRPDEEPPSRPPCSPAVTLAGSMSTRRLIVAALLCGLAILVAFTVQLTMAT